MYLLLDFRSGRSVGFEPIASLCRRAVFTQVYKWVLVLAIVIMLGGGGGGGVILRRTSIPPRGK